MKLSAVSSATLLIAATIALALASPALAKSKKQASPNDLACAGIWEMCTGLCDAQYPPSNNGQEDGWSDCMKKCGDEGEVCRRRDDIAMTTSLSSSNPEIFDPSSPPTGGGGGGAGSFGDGTASLHTAGMDAGGGAATIY